MGAEAIATLVIALVGDLAKLVAAKTEEARRALELEANRKIIEFTRRAQELGDSADAWKGTQP